MAHRLRNKIPSEGFSQTDLIATGIVPPEILMERTWLELLQDMVEGKAMSAPIWQALNFTPTHVEAGAIVFHGRPESAHRNPVGAIQGGWMAALLDACLSGVIVSVLPIGKSCVTLELKINYVRALTLGAGEVRAEGKIIHAGSSVAVAEGRLVDAHDRLYAHATTTCLIVKA